MKNWGMVIVLPLLLTGCLSPAPKAPTYWNLESSSVPNTTHHLEPECDVVRMGRLTVRAPYDSQRLTVLRENGSIAFDGYNAFAASPSALLKGLAQTQVKNSQRFTNVVDATSAAFAPYSLEILVHEFTLDCRQPGQHLATVRVEVTLLKGREIVDVETANSLTAVEEGQFGRAFSMAFSQAVKEAVDNLALKK